MEKSNIGPTFEFDVSLLIILKLILGRFWRTTGSERQRWTLVFGWNHKLGHWLRRTQPPRGLHPNLKIHRLDTLKCHLSLLFRSCHEILNDDQPYLYGCASSKTYIQLIPIIKDMSFQQMKQKKKKLSNFYWFYFFFSLCFTQPCKPHVSKRTKKP